MKNIGIMLTAAIFFVSCAGKRSLENRIGTKKGYSVEEYIDNELGALSGFYGFSMQKAGDTSIAYQVDADKRFDPASNIKMLTLYACLTYLGETVNTFKYYDEGGKRYLMPLGDPSFLHPDFDNTAILGFLRNGPDTLVIDLSRQREINRFGPGWAWDDYLYEFSAERSIFPIYGNTVKFYKEKDKVIGIPGGFAVESVSAPLRYVYEREESENRYKLRTSWGGVNPYHIPFIWSAPLAEKLLQEVTGKIIITQSINTLPEKYIQTAGSVGRDTLLRKMFRESNNFIAEQLLINIGYDKLNANSAESAVYYVDKMLFSELNLGGYKWVDGSGLSPYNRMSPAFAVNFLDLLLMKVQWEKLKQYFPEPGKRGSMANWSKTERNYFYAKTGNKTGISSLSGYLDTQGGDRYIFSMMITNFSERNTEVQKRIETILQRLAKDL